MYCVQINTLLQRNDIIDSAQLRLGGGKAAWAVCVDVYVLDANGCVGDAVLLATVAALQAGHHTMYRPKYCRQGTTQCTDLSTAGRVPHNVPTLVLPIVLSSTGLSAAKCCP
jgi:exosome complex RNA-binding protein Rrp42 (RNase PH superfamily)